MRKHVKMMGLTCSSCSLKITNKLLEDRSIDYANYNLINETMVIDYKGDVNLNIKQETKRIQKIVSSFEDGVIVSFDGEISSEEVSFISKYWLLFLGAIVFLTGYYVDQIYLIYAGYALFVSKIAIKSIKSMITKISFDENMLMFIATIAAMYIGEHFEAMAVIIFYTIGEYFQSKAVDKSKNEIKSLIDLKVDVVNVYRGGLLMQLSPEEIVVGDRIQVKPGERIPVDGQITTGSTSIDTSSLTGESKPVDVTVDDQVLSGSINMTSPIEMVASKEYSESTIAKIIEMLENSTMNKANTEEFITKFAKYYTPIISILAFLVFLIPTLLNPGNHQEYLYPAAVFLVISCPCALVLSVPLTYFAGIGKAASNNVLFKGSNHLDSMSEVTDVFLDKTGTITYGNLVVSKFTNVESLLIAASIEKFSNHPIANAIVSANQYKLLNIENVVEHPGLGMSGSFEDREIIVGNARFMKENKVEFDLQNSADTLVFVAVSSEYIGCINISDEIKETSRLAIDELGKLGINVTMLTGDNDKVAKKVALELGDISYKANLLPQNKSDYIENSKVEASSLFVGDGINDSIALANASVGVTMGQKGSDLALEVSDVVLLTDDLSLLAKTIRLAKKTRKIVVQNIAGTLIVKVLFLGLGLLGFSTMWMAIIADVGVSLVAILNSLRILNGKFE